MIVRRDSWLNGKERYSKGFMVPGAINTDGEYAQRAGQNFGGARYCY